MRDAIKFSKWNVRSVPTGTGQKNAALGWFLGISSKKQTYRVQAIRGKPSELLIFAYWLSYDFPLKFLHFLECWKSGSAGGNVGGDVPVRTVWSTPPHLSFPVGLVHHMRRFPQEGASVTASGPLFMSVTYKLYQ